MREFPSKVENYTTAFLVTTWVILFMALFTLAATKGYIGVLLAAAGFDLAIRVRAARLRTRKVRQNS